MKIKPQLAISKARNAPNYFQSIGKSNYIYFVGLTLSKYNKLPHRLIKLRSFRTEKIAKHKARYITLNLGHLATAPVILKLKNMVKEGKIAYKSFYNKLTDR